MLPHEEHPSFFESRLSPLFRERALWAVAGVIVLFLLFLISGGLYTITPPNGPVDTAYVMNRLTGKVWLVKTYTKQVGDVRVLTARQAAVEKTKDLPDDTVGSSVTMNETGGDRLDYRSDRGLRRR